MQSGHGWGFWGETRVSCDQLGRETRVGSRRFLASAVTTRSRSRTILVAILPRPSRRRSPTGFQRTSSAATISSNALGHGMRPNVDKQMPYLVISNSKLRWYYKRH